MRQKIKSLASNKEFYWTLLFQMTTLVGGILLIKLLAVSLSKIDYGFFALIASIVSFFLMMPFTALLQGISRYVSIYQNKGQYRAFLSSAVFLILGFLSFYILFVYSIEMNSLSYIFASQNNNKT